MNAHDIYAAAALRHLLREFTPEVIDNDVSERSRAEITKIAVAAHAIAQVMAHEGCSYHGHDLVPVVDVVSRVVWHRCLRCHDHVEDTHDDVAMSEPTESLLARAPYRGSK